MNYVSLVGKRARTLFARTQGKQMWGSSPIDSYLLLYLALFCDVMWCSLFACEEAAQAREQSLTNASDEVSHSIQCTPWRDGCVEACYMMHADVQENAMRINNLLDHLNQTRLRLLIELNHRYANNCWSMRCFVVNGWIRTVVTRNQ